MGWKSTREELVFPKANGPQAARFSVWRHGEDWWWQVIVGGLMIRGSQRTRTAARRSAFASLTVARNLAQKLEADAA